jgi:hypothetical protein
MVKVRLEIHVRLIPRNEGSTDGSYIWGANKDERVGTVRYVNSKIIFSSCRQLFSNRDALDVVLKAVMEG